MLVRKTVVNSLSWAMMGFAVTGAAYGQVAVPEIGDGSIVRDGQIKTDTVTEAPAPTGDAAAANVKNNVDNAVSDAQKSEIQAGSRATLGTDGQNIDAGVKSNVNADVNALSNPSTDLRGSNGANNVNPFGATFDSGTTDRLIIRELQPNSVASRLGLQAGDRIIGINGQTYNDVSQFDRELGQLNGNTEMPIIYERNGMRYTKNFRMSLQDAQQSHSGTTYENSWSNQRSYNTDQVSHSVGRPNYGVSSNSGYSGGMVQHQGYQGGTGAYGNHTYSGQSLYAGSYHGQARNIGHHSGGRRHRRCGR